jgi:type 1 glutamine amidotransferase
MKTNSCLKAPWHGVLALLLFLGHAAGSEVAAPVPLRVLLFSGQNNHDWKTTTPKLRAILTDSGRFTVAVTERPDQCTAETFARCDVIVCNWNAWGTVPITNWPVDTRTAFLNFIRNGGGHVVVHAGGSSFYDWPEYQQIGGTSWELAQTSHGTPHTFTVQPDAAHPITRGLAPFKTTDELWLKPGIHPTAKVIATGDGQPLAVTTEFGQGRGFATLLSHAADFMETPGFQALLLRGTEWAATGKVTIRGPGDPSAPNPD